MEKNFKAVLLTILTISLFTIAIIELTGISKNSLNAVFSKEAKAKVEETRTRSQQVAEMPKTTMQFYETKHDFGKQKEGAQLKHVFRFKNTGPNPLMISKTDVTCGCTVPSFPNEPIAPGKEGEITVVFNSSGKSGMQNKNVLVHSNAELESVSIGIIADITK